MWLSLSQAATSRLALIDRQSIWPAPDGSDAELLITTRALLQEDVTLAAGRLFRLRYTALKVGATMTLNAFPEAPWPDAAYVTGRNFELTVTEKGAIMAPVHTSNAGPKLPNRQMAWLNTIAEDVRCSWSVPPSEATLGLSWKTIPVLPGGLPPGTTSADIDIDNTVTAVSGRVAQISVAFRVRLLLERQETTDNGHGIGALAITLDHGRGITAVRRQARIEIQRRGKQTQLIRSAMELARL